MFLTWRAKRVRRQAKAEGRFICWDRSSTAWAIRPVGMCFTLTADSCLLWCWPPGLKLSLAHKSLSLYPKSISLTLSSLYLSAQWCRSWLRYVFWQWVCRLWVLLIWVCGFVVYVDFWVCGFVVYVVWIQIDYLWVCWNLYAFSKNLIQALLLVITVMDKDDDCTDRVEFEVKIQFSISKPMDRNPNFLSLNWWPKPTVAFSQNP